MTLQQLYYFRTIAKYKNYTKASQEILVAQSTLSHSIADLERELGVPLFYKLSRNIDITDYGVKFLEYVERIIIEFESAKQEMKLLLDPNFGRVRLTFANTLSNHFIPNIVKKFCENPANHTVQFEFSENQANKILESFFKNKKTDLGFGVKIDNDLLEYYPIINQEMILIVSKKHHLALRRSIDLQDLETESEKMMASIVAADLGVGIMPYIPELDVYDVVPLQLNNSALKRTLYMMWPKNEFMLPVVKNFRDFVINTVNSEK